LGETPKPPPQARDLSASAIEREIDGLGAPRRPISVVATTASTNDDARNAAAAPHGSAFLADSQTRGRGRRGHTWHSPPGENLYLSVLLRPRVEAAAIAAVTLAIGVAVARVLEAALLSARAPVWVKWPNDVLAGAEKRKLSGVLVEGQLRGAEVAGLVAGVGVNVHASSFPEDLAARATSLRILGGQDLDRSALAARLIVAIGEATAAYEADRLVSFRHDLTRLDGLRGGPVEVSGVRGIAEGVDDEGRLLVRGEAGELIPVVAGEVTVG
jgi:BirA family biotin operon repressor/biotin-[acetyl-CoA-carboxylase] ligase